MRLRDRKLQILHQLSLQSEPIGLLELVGKLQTSHDIRTVRRWLNSLIEEGLVSKIGSTKNTKYLVVKKKNNTPEKDNTLSSVSSCFSSESLKAIEQIKRPIYERYPVAYNDDWLDSYIPNNTFYLSKKNREQLLQMGQRANDQDPAGTYAHHIYNRLLIDLSYNSSRLEGNTYSLLDTERLLLFGDSPSDKLDEEKIMILNHKEAIHYLVENAAQITVSKETIFTLHYLLADGLLEPKYAGKVRDHPVRVGGSVYMPYEESKKIQHQIELISEKAAKIENPFEQSFFLLIHISYIQAFADVNKRTARLCANIPLITQNLVPLSFNDLAREDYTSAMIAIYELQDVRPMVDLYVFSYLRTCAAYDSTLKSIGYDAIRVRYRSQRRGIIREIILGNLVGSALNAHLQTRVEKEIPQKAQKDFLQDILEDLDQMDASRIAGLGITLDQLSSWLAHYKN